MTFTPGLDLKDSKYQQSVSHWDGNSPFPFTLYGARRSIVGASNKMQPEHITAPVAAKQNKENESSVSLVRSLFSPATDLLLFIAFLSLLLLN